MAALLSNQQKIYIYVPSRSKKCRILILLALMSLSITYFIRNVFNVKNGIHILSTFKKKGKKLVFFFKFKNRPNNA